MQAIILAGGFGTRLRSVLTDVPKPMAPIHGKPFLAYLLDYLQKQGITNVVLSVHYLREQIQQYFGEQYQSLFIQYAIEETPLGTGGAIVHALQYVDCKQPVFVINGDTFLKVQYQHMLNEFDADAKLMMTLREVPDCSRYGEVILQNKQVVEFKEQGAQHAGLINAGVYLLRADLFNSQQVKSFSFERDFLFPNIKKLKPLGFRVDDYFIDIGVPVDYERVIASVDTLQNL